MERFKMAPITVRRTRGRVLTATREEVSATMTTVYTSALSGPEHLEDWIIECPMAASFPTGRLRLESEAHPAEGQAANLVVWLPFQHEGDVRAAWDFRPLRGPGPAMISWAAQARGGGSHHAPALPPRTGEYEQYQSGAIDAYHLSYF